jgi:phosphoethanolamine N-methyltransferase
MPIQPFDEGQYSLKEIAKYEAIYGRNFVSPGGEPTTRALLGLADLRAGMRVLDIGCGLGGAAFLIAQTYGARVHGIDLSDNMLRLARERCQEARLTDRVSFERADIVQYTPPITFDLAHSRDVFLHIHDKAGLFAAIRRCLRPGGQLLFTDYLCRAGERTPEFANYIRSRGYDLRAAEEYRVLLDRAGFEVRLAEDRTAEFAEILERELAQLGASALGEPDRSELAQSWRDKLRRARAGEQRWGVFLARKRE